MNEKIWVYLTIKTHIVDKARFRYDKKENKKPFLIKIAIRIIKNCGLRKRTVFILSQIYIYICCKENMIILHILNLNYPMVN